jgi:REP element-mobilizing transposase RayT
MFAYTEYKAQFFTATILNWEHLLIKDQYKEVVTDSLRFLSVNKRAAIHAFVIMPNHIHLIWTIDEKHKRENVQRDFLKFTSQRIKADLVKHDPVHLERFRVNAKDRKYQIWERNPLSIDIYSEKVMEQKLNYLHENPVQYKWKLSELAEDYKYSSASFYETGKDTWGFLVHYDD